MEIKIVSDNALDAVYSTIEEAAAHTFEPGQFAFAFITFDGVCPRAYEYTQTLALAYGPGDTSVTLLIYADKFLLVLSCILGDEVNEKQFQFILGGAQMALSIAEWDERYMVYEEVITSALTQVNEYIIEDDDDDEIYDDLYRNGLLA